MSIVWYFAALVVLIALSAFFSASEMSYSSANRLRLENAAEDGDRRAKTAVGILDHFDRTLSAILIGNNLVNIAASSLGLRDRHPARGRAVDVGVHRRADAAGHHLRRDDAEDRRQAERQRHRPAQCLYHPRAVGHPLPRDLARRRARAPHHAPAARRCRRRRSRGGRLAGTAVDHRDGRGRGRGSTRTAASCCAPRSIFPTSARARP